MTSLAPRGRAILALSISALPLPRSEVVGTATSTDPVNSELETLNAMAFVGSSAQALPSKTYSEVLGYVQRFVELGSAIADVGIDMLLCMVYVYEVVIIGSPIWKDCMGATHRWSKGEFNVRYRFSFQLFPDFTSTV